MIGTLDDFEKLCKEKLEDYLLEKQLETVEKELTIQRYQEEMKLLRKQVAKNPQYVQGMWLAYLLGELGKRTGIMIRNRVLQCPFLFYLLNLTSYNVLEAGYLEKRYLYKKSGINPFSYIVEKEFYENVGRELEEMVAKYGYFLVWVGGVAPEELDEKNVQPVKVTGFMMMTRTEFTIISLEYYHCLGALQDGRECIMEDELYELQNEGVVKGEMVCLHRPFRYDLAESFTREDLWNEFVELGMSEKRAYYWAEMVRKGKLSWKIKTLPECERLELLSYVGWKRMEELVETLYLPSRWMVLESVYSKE